MQSHEYVSLPLEFVFSSSCWPMSPAVLPSSQNPSRALSNLPIHASEGSPPRQPAKATVKHVSQPYVGC